MISRHISRWDYTNRRLAWAALLLLPTLLMAEPPAAMVPIPGGVFTMGDDHKGAWRDERPRHAVAISPFLMDRCEITNRQLCDMLQWALGQGRIAIRDGAVVSTGSHPQELLQLGDWNSELHFADGRFSVDPDRDSFPCVEITWYGALAYATFRSLREGLPPCVNLDDWSCDFSRSGYRLPTEAEWERAARGGLIGEAFPWPRPDPPAAPIDGTRANYWLSGDPYETSRPDLQTTPAGYYDGRQTPSGAPMTNGYGLYDMAGNVWEWCWDIYDPAWYATADARRADPTGPTGGVTRVKRGGSWLSGNREAARGDTNSVPGRYLRCANRASEPPERGSRHLGFRCVRRP